MPSNPFDAIAGGIDLDPESFPHVLTLVERQVVVGRDRNGAPVYAWPQVYANLQAFVTTPSTADLMEWQQKGIVASHKIYIPQQPIGSGNLPVLGVRDRITMGTRPGTAAPRHFEVTWWENVAEAGLLGETSAREVVPGA
jgi:hypothetical protein